MKTVIAVLVGGILIAGCVTSPSSLSDLGEESMVEKVTGDAIYFGFFGLSFDGKEIVYEQALRNAIRNGPPGTTMLGDVKLWETHYTSANVLVAFIPFPIVLLLGDNAFATVVVSLFTFLVSGIEIVKFTVVCIPITE